MSITCPKDATLPNLKKTFITHLKEGKLIQTHHFIIVYVPIKRLNWKGHCTLWNTFVVSLSVLAVVKMSPISTASSGRP